MTQKLKVTILSLGLLLAGLLFTAVPALAVSPLGNGCSNPSKYPQTAAGQHACLAANPLVTKIQDVVNFLSAGVAVVIAGSIIVAGIQYTMAGNQPQVLAAARNRIINAVIALFAFLLTFAFLQWIIPGGIFS